MAAGLEVEVAWVRPPAAVVVRLTVPEGTTLAGAVERSGLLRDRAIDLARCALGTFGRLRSPEEPVRDGDRVELYRPLAADPREMRRRRARGSGR